MCFDHDSRPPITPIAGGSLDAGDIELTSADGSTFGAFLARAAQPTGTGIVILPDVRGVHAYYKELALRFAERGVDAIALDYFGRTAGIGDRGPSFDYQPHVPQTTFAGLRADTVAAAKHLRAVANPKHLYATGFCMGGRLAFLTATYGLGLDGVIGFYGWPTGPSRNGTPAPADLAGEMEGRVLGIFGGADEGIPASAAVEFEAALAKAGVDHEITTYAGAPHSFFDRKAADYADASARAWEQTLRFMGLPTEHAPAGQP
jgi:carboxymethylenebutenolidase